MSARELGKSQRREDILRAARDLMRQTGDLHFSMRTLAEQAGVSIATPYNLFGSKQNILLAVLDDDLREYQQAISELHADGVDVLFEGIRIMSALLRREPEFYRNMLRAVSQGGPEFQQMVNGPRYVLWKKLLRQATDAGLLVDHVDPDAFAIASSQIGMSNVLEWAQGGLTLDEMEARNHYGLALVLLAVATDLSRPPLQAHLRTAEQRLQTLWRTVLAERLRKGDLDEETREILADQIKHLNSKVPEKTP
jgi:AcrR family transcriptional regulator